MSALEGDYAQFRGQLEDELTKVERLIADLEAQYMQAEHCQHGSVLRILDVDKVDTWLGGFEGFLSSKENMRKRARASKVDERMFSLSSRSSPATREAEQAALEMMDSATPMGFGKKGYANKGYANKGKR